MDKARERMTKTIKRLMNNERRKTLNKASTFVNADISSRKSQNTTESELDKPPPMFFKRKSELL